MLVSRLPAVQSGRFDHESTELGETKVLSLVLGHETELRGLRKRAKPPANQLFRGVGFSRPASAVPARAGGPDFKAIINKNQKLNHNPPCGLPRHSVSVDI